MRISKVTRIITAGIVATLGLLNAIDAIYAAGYVSATDQALTAEVNIESSATVTISTSSVNLNVTPSRNGTFGSTYKSASVQTPITVSVYTNSASAFDVQMIPASTSLTSGSNTIATLPSDCAAGCTANSTYFQDKWGYSTDGTTYYPVSSPTTIDTITANTGSTAATTNVYFGMKLTGATAPGTYSNTLNFSVTATPAP